MRIDPDKHYMMPLIMGPVFDKASGIPYPEIEVVALQYRTDPDAIQELLPDCYRVADEPVVTVMFGYNNGLAFMAGGEYRLATVQVAARFDGRQDQCEGDYILVMFENKTWPILGGRENLGVHKLYADISSVKQVPSGRLRCEASLWGHLLFGIDLAPIKRQNAVVRSVASRRINARPWLGYKYIPALDGPPDADYPTITKNDVKIKELWLGNSGSVYFGDPGVEDVAQIKHLLDALKTLSVNQTEQALRFRGSAVLRFDLSHRLR
jgi:acetoacetate decarboxylase